jgi:hypothetical protein
MSGIGGYPLRLVWKLSHCSHPVLVGYEVQVDCALVRSSPFIPSFFNGLAN